MFRRPSYARTRERNRRILALRERMAELAVVVLDLETIVRQGRSDRRGCERRLLGELDPVRREELRAEHDMVCRSLERTIALQDQAHRLRAVLGEELGQLVRTEAAAAELAMVRRARRGRVPSLLAGFGCGVALTAAVAWPEPVVPAQVLAAAPVPDVAEVILVSPAEEPAPMLIYDVTGELPEDNEILDRILQGANSTW